MPNSYEAEEVELWVRENGEVEEYNYLEDKITAGLNGGVKNMAI